MRDPLGKKIKDIKPSGIRKFFDLVVQLNDKNVISLGVGEPDFDTPWHIREEGIYSLEKGRTFYTSNSGLKELRTAVSGYTERQLGIRYDDEEEILITVGGSEAIDIALRAMLDPGDEVLIPQPSYVSYEPCTVLAGGVPVIIELKDDNDFSLSGAQVEAAITDKTKVLVMPFPNNPTGSIMKTEDLRDVARVVREHDLYVISDEIYAALTYTKSGHISIANMPGMRDRTVVINGFSKAFAMTGWRLGYAMGPANIIDQMRKIHQYAIMCAPTTSQYAAVEAMNNGDKDVEMMKEAYDQRRRFLLDSFRKMGLDCFEPLGAFYVFPCIKKLGMTSDKFAEELLNEQKLAVVPGTAFGDCGEGFIRVSYAYSLEELEEAMRRMEAFVKAHLPE
ncbi:MAG: aminotransferase class I/II-fold pyridoxal phosphate-dependent enzyme [Lachnospiraceae bacterium]|nr:aminotransferase class I/II-fold pyridoxal phosphate-dependent enzyme [Lachnospiraceae bacterium]